MQNPFTNAGTLFYISATLPASYDAAGYGNLSFTQIRGIRSTGDIGEAYQTFDYNPIIGTRYNKRSGKLAKSLNAEIIIIDDAGQSLLKAALTSVNAYSYKVLCVDGVIYYFTAECSQRFRNIGQANSLADLKLTLEINSELLEI